MNRVAPLVLAILASVWGCAGGERYVGAGEPASGTPPIVAQKPLGRNACGPCAVMNGLLWGDASLRAIPPKIQGDTLERKVETLISRYGTKPSEAYGPKKPRYDAASGVTWVDLTQWVNDVLADHGGSPPVTGAYLDRGSQEPPGVFLRRVHEIFRESLKEGMPVITSIRSFAPTPSKNGSGYVWSGLLGHWVAVVRVQDRIRDGEKGFSIEFVDSATGKKEYGYLFLDEARNFTAAKGDGEKWEWVTDRPFLLVRAPSLRLGTQRQPWNLRTIITLNYAIFRRGVTAKGGRE